VRKQDELVPWSWMKEMYAINSWRVAFRIQLLVSLSLIGLLLVSAAALYKLRDTMIEDRKAKVKNLVEYAISQLQFYEEEARSGRMTVEQAQETAKRAFRAARYDDNNYFWINDFHPRSIVHPIKPEIEGKDMSENKDATGKLLYLAFVDVVKTREAGFIDYKWVKKAGEAGMPKIAYVQGFRAWGWIVGTGIYIDDVDREFLREVWELAGIVVGVLAFSTLIGWFIGVGILRQLGGEPDKAVALMRQIAEGNLAVAIRQPRPGSLMEAIDQMVHSVRELVQKIENGAEQVVNSSEQINVASHHIAKLAEQESDSTSSMAAALEELTVASQLIADNASSTEKTALRAMTLAAEGSTQVDQATAVAQKLSSTVLNVAQQINSLDKRIQDISAVSGTIKDIAGQTNLLALNAAIEAARAGEQGRGFAVVADEVRKLAERTALATTGITEMVGVIQQETSSAVQAMNDVLPEVERGVQITTEAASSLQSIRNESQQSLQSVAEIANATKEQSLSATFLTQRVEDVLQVVEETTLSIRQAADTATQLEDVAHSLRAQISRFQL